MTTLQTPLTAQAVMTSGTAPSVGKFNIYNAASGSISATLPALSGLNVGARLSVGKYIGDSSTNTVTVTCSGSDKFQDGSTSSLVIYEPGSQRELQVISVSSTKYWQIVGGIISPTVQPVTVSNTVSLTNKSLTSPKIVTSLLDTNGNILLGVTATGSAVNYATLSNYSTGSGPILGAAGSDTNIPIRVTSKGTSAVTIGTLAGTANTAQFMNATNSVNYFRFTPAATGTAPILSSFSATDTNVSLNLQPQGTGLVQANGVEVMTASATINAQTGTTYTLVLGDAGHLVTLDNGSAITLTVPANASVAYPTGTKIDLAQLGAGQVTVAAAGGVTVNATPGLKISAQYGGARLVKLATNTWLLTGDLAA